MFKRIKAYFAGVPTPTRGGVLEGPCRQCTDLGYTCLLCFVPGEPVLSILRAVKTRRKTLLLSEKFESRPHASRYMYGFADTTTGRAVTVSRSCGYRQRGLDYPADLGLTRAEVEWLLQEIQRRVHTVQARAAVLAALRARRHLMQEYVQ